MANGLTLTETAYWTRRLILGSVILLVVVVVGRVGLNSYRRRQFQQGGVPLTVERPNTAFGILPRLRFSGEITSRPLSFELQTVTGTIPPTPPIAKVFLMPRPAGVTFFSLEKGKEFAGKLGFSDEPRELSLGQYRWLQEVKVGDEAKKGVERSLVLDVISGNFSLNYDLAADPEIGKGTLPDQKQAEGTAVEFLKNLGLYLADLASGERRVSYLKLEGGQKIPTASQADADLIEVSFFRRGVKNALLGQDASQEVITPITQPIFNQAQVRVTLSGAGETERKFVSVEYIFWPVDYENYATYPLKTGQQAFENLSGGEGAILSGGNQSKAVIRRVKLAYYDPAEHQDFLQPIFIFEGDRSFVAYVPAIANAWIEAGGSTSSQE